MSNHIKTLSGWYDDTKNLDEYLQVGDRVTEDLVDYFVNILPPILMWSSCTQVGGAIYDAKGKDGKIKPTFITFKRIDSNIWEYCGNCFKGEIIHRAFYREGKA